MTAFPAVSYGATKVTSADGSWTILADYNKNTCTVISYNGSDANLVIPSKIDGLKVTELQFGYQIGRPDSNRWKNRKAIVTIQIPSTVTSIGYASFANLPNLKSVKIPTSVKTFGTSLFAECTSLESFTIPTAMKEVPNEIFGGCTSLSKVTFHSKVTALGSSAFSGCTSLKKITLPSSLKTIGYNCFGTYYTDKCGLETISIPNSVTSIAVSYTHLDVYKRQSWRYLHWKGCRRYRLWQ